MAKAKIKRTKILLFCLVGLAFIVFIQKLSDPSELPRPGAFIEEEYYNYSCRGTLITAYYNISSKHSPAEYREWMTNIMTLQDCMVIIISPELEPVIREMRPKEYPTYIIKKPIEHLEVRKELTEKEWIAQEMMDHELKIGHNKVLYTVWNEKANFLHLGASLNPFNSEYFVWLDMGAIRHDAFRHEKMLKHFPIARGVVFLEIAPFEKTEFIFKNGLSQADFTHKDRLGAGMIGGRREEIEMWRQEYYKVFRNHVKQGRFIGKEQNLLAAVCLNTELCLLMKQPRPNQKPAEWFYLQEYYRGVLTGEPIRFNISHYRRLAEQTTPSPKPSPKPSPVPNP